MLRRIKNYFQRTQKKSSHITESNIRSHPVSWASQNELPIRPFSSPMIFSSTTGLPLSEDGIVQPEYDPQIVFPLLRRLRDYIPDVSAGVWAWVRLCSTPQSYTLLNGNNADREHAKSILAQLDRKILEFQHERERGCDALIQSFFLSVFTYGAFCGEVVLEPDRRGIESFVIIDPASIRFRYHSKRRELQPLQIQPDGHTIALNPASFYYYGLDTDGLSPYGRSPLLAVPLVAKIQQQMVDDMARAQHNAGYPTIHFRLAKPEPERDESPRELNERMQNEMVQVRDEIEKRKADSNLVTFDNLEVNYVGPSGYSYQWSESIQAISEQVISALHLAPFMLGRNWGTTESWGTAQYQLLTNNARSIQEGAKRLAEWIRNLELILKDSPCSVSHTFAPHHHLDSSDRAQAFRTTADAIASLQEKGLVQKDYAQEKIETLLKFL